MSDHSHCWYSVRAGFRIAWSAGPLQALCSAGIELAWSAGPLQTLCNDTCELARALVDDVSRMDHMSVDISCWGAHVKARVWRASSSRSPSMPTTRRYGCRMATAPLVSLRLGPPLSLEPQTL